MTGSYILSETTAKNSLLNIEEDIGEKRKGSGQRLG